MKTLLIIDANLGQARAYMAKTLLGAAAHKANLEIIDNPNDAELAIVLGESLPNDNALNGKKVWLGDIGRAVAHPELFLSEAKSHATPYSAPAAAAPAASAGPKRVVAVTACPTGVAHTLWRLKPLKQKRKTRLVGKSRNARLRGGRQCHHPGRGGGSGFSDCGGGYRSGSGEVCRSPDVPYVDRPGAEKDGAGAG